MKNNREEAENMKNDKHPVVKRSNIENTAPENVDTDKYLAMEQPGVTYTHDTDPTASSDHAKYGSENSENAWNAEGGNSRNSDAFNQDDYLLEDNVDLDEDQNQSISSDDEDFEETNERY